MAEIFDLDSVCVALDLEPVTIDLDAAIEFNLDAEPISLDCLEYPLADTGGANEPV